MSEANETQAMTDEDVNALYESVTQPKSANIAESEPESYELDENVKVSKEELLDWAKQGYTAKNAQEEWAQKQKEIEENYNYYKQVDEWAKSNPDTWKHVLDSYESREQLTKEDNALYNKDTPDLNDVSPELQPYIEKITDLETKLSTIEGRLDLGARQEEDSALEQEINSVREQYSGIDWDNKDESGATLEHKVLRHAQELGTTSFRAAFRDMMHDDLLSRAKEEGMSTVTKEIQKKTKLGLLGETKESIMKLSSGKNTKAKSYDDLLNEGLEELGIKL